MSYADRRLADFDRRLADRIRSAANVQEALVVIAEGLDALLEASAHPLLVAPATPAPDAFMEWDNQQAHSAAHRELQSQVQTDLERLREIRSRMEQTTDGEERLALEAALRLAEDAGASIDLSPAEGHRVTAAVTDDNITVQLPAASPGKRKQRLRWAMDNKLWEYQALPALKGVDFAEAYAKGGPLWLYNGDRDAVIQMPVHLRRAMVQDVDQDSPAEAQELARDILKDGGTGVSSDFALEALQHD